MPLSVYPGRQNLLKGLISYSYLSDLYHHRGIKYSLYYLYVYHLLLSLLSQGLMVHQEFVDMVQEINHSRPFQAEYGVVSQGKNIEGTIDRWVENYLLWSFRYGVVCYLKKNMLHLELIQPGEPKVPMKVMSLSLHFLYMNSGEIYKGLNALPLSL